MDEEKYMCYITYAIPREKMAEFFPVPKMPVIEETEEFVPQWFNAGGFPEDDY